MSGYTQLTQEERYQIYIPKKAGYHQAEIAAMLERHTSTVSRERKRTQGLKGYRPKQAHGLPWPGAMKRLSPVLSGASGSMSNG